MFPVVHISYAQITKAYHHYHLLLEDLTISREIWQHCV